MKLKTPKSIDNKLNASPFKCCCKNHLDYAETWIEVDNEYRHIEFLICTTCKKMYSLNGTFILTYN